MEIQDNSKPHKIVIYTSESFPHGLAATSRILSYAAGFLSHNKEIRVVCIRRTEKRDNIENHESKGIYKHIPYQYLSDSTIRSATFLQRRIDVAVMNFRLLVNSLLTLNRNSLAIFYSSRTSAALILRLTSWIRGYMLVKEESEFPDTYLVEKKMVNGLVFKWLHYRLFDGLFLMTRYLVDYFRDEKHYKKPVLLVPMTVDFQRFNLPDVQKKKTIAYCGILNDSKDGTDVLINAFAKIERMFPEYSLVLYGDATDQIEWEKYHRMVSGLNIEGKVRFYGRVKAEEIPGYLSEATVLVLPRPASIQAKYGFPTKLGEYLATGNPVIVTPVGEIPDYLKDQHDAFFVLPGNAPDLADKLVKVLTNMDFSRTVGENGKKTARQFFSNIEQTKKILDFYKTI